VLTFHLAGINNQNFIMRDEETGSWWQQVSGEAIQGPLKGKKLNAVFNDEVSFAIWQTENPHGRVLKPNETVASRYSPANWEEGILNLPTVTANDARDGLDTRSLILGVVENGASRAYPIDAVAKERLIIDSLGGTPLMIVAAKDGKSVRGFNRRVEGRTLEFFVEPDTEPPIFIDAQTGSKWDFTGRAVSGTLEGKELKRVFLLKDYWFDWKIYHPKTSVFSGM
jgi:hypothetical protein